MTYYFIYKTTNIITGEYYIGKHKTVNLKDGYLGSGLRLRNSIKKYGVSNFIREIIEFCPDDISLNQREFYYVDLYIIEDKCINIAKGGQGGCIVLYPEHPKYKETCDKISNSKYATSELISERVKLLHKEKRCGMHNKKHSEDSKKKIGASQKGRNLGKILPDNVKKKISDSLKGKPKAPFSEEHINNISKNHRDVKGENNPMFAKNHSKETKEKISKKAKNRPKVICEFCGKSTTNSNYKRWHGDNCKMRIVV